MASTNRDFRASLPNYSPELVETVVSGVPAPESYTSTPASSKTQAAAHPSVLAARTAAVAKLVNTAFALHGSANGSTVSLAEGNMVGRRLFAVSIYPERSIALTAPPTWQNIFAFVSLNLDLLAKRAHAFGSWFDHPEAHVLDVVLLLPDRRMALELGRIFGEKSIYHLAAQRVIAIRSNSSKRPSRRVLRSRRTKATAR